MDPLPPPPDPDPRWAPPGIAAGRAIPDGPVVPPDATVRNAGWLSVIGGILVVIGGFLPILQISSPGGVATVAGTKAGIGVIFLGGFAILKGFSALRASGLQQRLSSPLVTAALLTLLLVWRWNDVHDAIARVEATGGFGVTATVGFGFWLDVVGTVLIAAGGLLMLRVNRTR